MNFDLFLNTSYVEETEAFAFLYSVSYFISASVYSTKADSHFHIISRPGLVRRCHRGWSPKWWNGTNTHDKQDSWKCKLSKNPTPEMRVEKLKEDDRKYCRIAKKIEIESGKLSTEISTWSTDGLTRKVAAVSTLSTSWFELIINGTFCCLVAASFIW